MSSINDNALSLKIQRQLASQQKSVQDSMAKLTSGSVFAGGTPKPADRAIAEKMELRLRSLAASRRNINDGISMIQMAEGGLSEITNSLLRLKEIGTLAASSTVGDQEREFLFVEFEAIRSEISRIAEAAEFNGMPLLAKGEGEENLKDIFLRVGDPMLDGNGEDMNLLKLTGLDQLAATAADLGVPSAKELLANAADLGGITLEAVTDLFEDDDRGGLAGVFDTALEKIAGQRAIFGSFQARMERSLDFMDVTQENIEATRSRIADTDYASEVTDLVKSQIAAGASTALLAQANMGAAATLQLLKEI